MKNTNNFVITSAFLLSLVAGTGTAQADSISFDLNLSNDMPDGVNYLTVTISDSLTTVGDIDFSVVVNTANYPSPGDNFGMDNFYFNYDGNLVVDSSDITGINPASWNVTTDKNAGGGFGFFEFDLKGLGNSRTELLTFSISGVDGDTIHSYAVGYEGGDTALFAAHVGGFDNGSGVSSAKFATVVPVPAAAWLFGSGLLALAGLVRRRA